jgi:hypothetical protein
MPLSTLVTSIWPPASSETSKKRRRAITTTKKVEIRKYYFNESHNNVTARDTTRAWRNPRPISRPPGTPSVPRPGLRPGPAQSAEAKLCMERRCGRIPPIRGTFIGALGLAPRKVLTGAHLAHLPRQVSMGEQDEQTNSLCLYKHDAFLVSR